MFQSNWAHAALKKMNDEGMTFSKTARMVCGDLQFYLEQKKKNQSAKYNIDIESDNDNIADVLYGRYGRNQKLNRSRDRFNRARHLRRKNSSSHAMPTGNSKRGLFFGCGSPNHFVGGNKCRPSELVNHFRNRLKSKTPMLRF